MVRQTKIEEVEVARFFSSKKKKESKGFGPTSVVTKRSGPINVAEFDCHACLGPSTLLDENCRACVFERLATEGDLDQVILRRACCKIYPSRGLSKLAKSFAALKQLALDRVLYGKDADKECGDCVDERMHRLVDEVWPKLLANPHDFAPLEELAKKPGRSKGKCAACTEEHFLKLIATIKVDIKRATSGLTPHNYDEIFAARTKPFFIEGVWHPPPRKARLIDSYGLSGGRGEVRIYQQLDRPVPFYELDLPEFKLPIEQLELLDDAFRMEIEEAPGQAKFAYSARMFGFAEDWYNTLLHALKERGGATIPSNELRKLSKLIASWLTYRILEPLSHDDQITDIYVPAPPELQPISVEHERWGKCETGIYWETPALLGLGETLASRLGVAFDEVRPQLDAEIPELGMRLFLSRYPAIWARSVEISIRKRRSTPWTQPLFLERGTLTPLASSLLSNVLRIGSSAFVIGEMGTAKTSQVETYIPEIGPEQRIVCYQDTEELHVEDFVTHGYKLANVRVADPEHLEKQVNAFLRGGPSYWLITEVRAAEAVKAALGAAARQGSQPVIASFHARSKREMFDLIAHIMGLHEAAFKYIDLIISTSRFSTPRGTIRRVTEIAEVLKEWEGKPEYVELFADDRKHDILVPKNFLKGDKRLISKLNSYDLSKLDVVAASKKLSFLPPGKGGSRTIPAACKKLAIDERDFLTAILAEARMKSDLLMLAEKSGNMSYLELPFVSAAYNSYAALVKRYAPDYKHVLREWSAWLKNIKA